MNPKKEESIPMQNKTALNGEGVDMSDPLEIQVPLVEIDDSICSEWSSMDFYDIVFDLTHFVVNMQRQSKGVFNPCNDAFKIRLPPSAAQHLSKTNDFGSTVSKFVKDTWPNATFITRQEVSH